ncbi:MAG: transposase [Planctomycetes bacterium]|nr:transposase [Planctomycetota bacterium]
MALFFFGWHARFTSNAHDAWAYKNGIELHFIAPGKPTENAFAESFNSRVHLHNL